jgi:hypothetical protein
VLERLVPDAALVVVAVLLVERGSEALDGATEVAVGRLGGEALSNARAYVASAAGARPASERISSTAGAPRRRAARSGDNLSANVSTSFRASP